jgi:uncharacterized protein YyaL (SSP411 family)
MLSRSSNRLAREKSPYLLQHSYNPVDWYPWGKEAFEKAKAEDKPIFLSIGYSTCHWCHVMEHESFESTAIAAFLNEHFVSIKVDREERPDVDQVYMTFIQATTGHGGWPMSVWLTPELKPFTGGTYFPPTDMPGRPGFITILRRIADLWKTDRKQIEDKAHSLLSALQEAHAEAVAPVDDDWHVEKCIQNGLSQFTRMFDTREGGFGSAPKFPRPVNLEFLLYVASRKDVAQQDADTARGMVLYTLRKMAAGGIHDHLGGGFHRYSVDAEWHVPHFEKMLYDQAQLAQAYLGAFQMSGDQAFAKVAQDILHYVEHDLTSPHGGFYSAEDADSLPKKDSARKTEGAFYIWTYDEIREVLRDDRVEEFRATYGVEAEGNVSVDSDPHGELEGSNVLIQRMSLTEAAAHFQRPIDNMEQRLNEDRAALLSRRSLRPRPHLDDKILTAWNGMMIGAFARAARVLGIDSYLHNAQQAALFIRKNMFDSTRNELLRSYREGPSTIRGFASDYVFLISGLLDLYKTDFDLEWIKWAQQLQDTLDLHFWDQKGGGYFSNSDKDPAILLRMKEDYDGAEPTPNSVAVRNLWRLGQLLHDDVLIEHAHHAVRAMASRLEAQPFAMPFLLVNAAMLKLSPIHLIVHSPSPSHPALSRMLAEPRRAYLPQMIVILIADGTSREFFASRHPAVESLPAQVAEPTAYLCENFTCRLPVTKPEELRKMLADL